MKKIIILCLVLIAVSCSSKKEGNMIVTGKISGLKKGTLYLQKMQDTLLVAVDSIALFDSEEFTLTDQIEDPVLYYLTFNDVNSEKRILFFGEKGIITINDKLDKFGFSPEITGSQNQKVLDEYNKVAKRFNDNRLDLIKENFEAQKEKSEAKIIEIQQKSNNLIKRRYLYTTNFVLNNPDTEAAAFITLSELGNASLKLLDTINSSLTDRVKGTTYGKRFTTFYTSAKTTAE